MNIFSTMRLLVFVLFFQSFALAQNTPLECLTDAEGLYLRWNSEWQKDKKDNGKIYRIERLTKIPGAKHYVLELQSSSQAVLTSRRLSVKKNSRLSNFCKNIAVEKSKLSKNLDNHKALQKTLKQGIVAKNISSRAGIQALKKANNKKKLPFIEFKNGRWVKGDHPHNAKTAICNVLSKRFSCRAIEKEQHSDKLKQLENQIAASKGIAY